MKKPCIYKAMIKFLYAFLFLVVSVSCSHSQKTKDSTCVLNRGGWDFGSGTIKVKVAKVDVCQKKILKVLYVNSEAVGFKQDLAFSKSQSFSKEIQKESKVFIQKVLKETKKWTLKGHKGVATAAFRESKNAKDYVKELKNEFGLDLRIISQEEEAALGVLSARTKVKGFQKEWIVWDIGGGSQQITRIKGETKNTYKSNWASVSFKNWVIKNIKKNKKVNTPNPLTKSEFWRAVKTAGELVSAFKMSGLSSETSKSINIYGVGGVHTKSLKPKMTVKSYTQKDLEKLSYEYLNLSDKDIGGGPYASTEVTNIALVLGTMKALNFYKVTPIDVGLVEGVLISSE